MVDIAVWRWIKESLLDPEVLRRDLKEQQEERERENQPLRDRLSVVDDLLADNRRQLEKLLDLYLAGDFPKEVLTERKTRLETTIAALEKERANLVMTLQTQTLTNNQILTIERFAETVADGLGNEPDFETKRAVIDLLDVRVTMAIEDGQRVAYLYSEVLDEKADLSIENQRFRACGTIDSDRT